MNAEGSPPPLGPNEGNIPTPGSPSPPTPPERPPASRSAWAIFGLVILLPALLTLATARQDNVWPIFTFGLNLLTSLGAGLWLGRRLRQPVVVRLIAGMAFAVGLFFLTFALCCVGCGVGGARLKFQ